MTAPLQPERLPADTAHLMRTVLIALIPGVIVFVYHTGWGGIFSLAVAVTSACVAEALALHLRGRDAGDGLRDYSAIVTGVLIALCLPPLLAWWIPALGALFAILLAKHAYGGLGHNIFNPAMAGYALLLVSFPRDLGIWLTLPDAFNTTLAFAVERAFDGGLVNYHLWDAVTGATALDLYRDMSLRAEPLTDALHSTTGTFGALHSEWLNLAYMAGGLWLMYKRIISWHIPLLIIISLATCILIESAFNSTHIGATLGLQVFGGATMLGAFFIATDPVSAASSKRGQILYAVGIGVLVYLIRRYGGYPDSIAFAVLIMNCCVPLIDRLDPWWQGGKKP